VADETRQRFLSYGGGVQSSALIVLAAQGRIAPIDAALFCNTGDDSEHPDTLIFVREVMRPYCEKHGIVLHELQRLHKGEPQTLYGRMMNHTRESLSEPIPVYGYSGAPMSRACTVDHKIKVLERWIRRNAVALPVETLIGISLDEIERAKTGQNAYEVRQYPLLDLGLNRIDCANIIADAGLPVPPKSSCFFCPFHSIEKAAGIEDKLNSQRANRDKPPVYLTRRKMPIRDAVTAAGDTLFSDGMAGECDGGFCFV
jgi:hypothetical protein